MNIYEFLDQHGLTYDKVEHPPVYTCQEAERWVPSLSAVPTKNLFLRDRKGLRHFLVVVGYEKSVDLKELSSLLGADRLLLASAERMQKYLGVEPGSVTLLGLMNDRERAVEVVFDQAIAEAPALRCHPLVNTATLGISQSDISRFLELTGHTHQTIKVPGR